jgi:hypothetical protein
MWQVVQIPWVAAFLEAAAVLLSVEVVAVLHLDQG